MRRSLTMAVIALMAITACTTEARPAPPERTQPLRARAAHTATLLRDGRVLIAGGCAVDGCSTAQAEPSSEFYLPGKGFVAGPAMRQPRDGHTATTLADGRILIVGGFPQEGSGALASTELYNPVAGAFEPGPPLRVARGGHTATRLRDGRVLIAGGWIASQTYTSTTEIFDPATNTFTPGADMPRALDAAAAILLSDGRVLVAGGEDTPQRGLAATALFDPAQGKWQAGPAMGTPRLKHAIATLADGRVLVLGGTPDDEQVLATTEIYDPGTNAFTAGPVMNASRYKFPDAVATLADHRLVVAGGTQVDIFDGHAFTPVAAEGSVANAGRVRSFSTATALPDGTVLVVGGYDDRIRILADAFLIRPSR